MFYCEFGQHPSKPRDRRTLVVLEARRVINRHGHAERAGLETVREIAVCPACLPATTLDGVTPLEPAIIGERTVVHPRDGAPDERALIDSSNRRSVRR